MEAGGIEAPYPSIETTINAILQGFSHIQSDIR